MLRGAAAVEAEAADVADHGVVSAAIKRIFDRRPVDVLICNAGVVRPGHLEDLTVQEVEEQVQTNLLGSIYPIQAVLPLMKRRSRVFGGSIVLMCSLSGLSFWYGAGVYTATKHAQRGLAECLRMELLPHRIFVTLVCPGFTDTPLLNDVEQCSQEMTEMMRVVNMYDRGKADTPAHIAACTLAAVKRRQFLVTTQQPMGAVLAALTRGLFPAESWGVAFMEALLLGPLRLVTLLVSFGVRRDMLHAFRKLEQRER
eukprot:SM000046S16375  [mRNA]  locus=s46:201434:203339:- [translate_table: standard]